MSPKLPKPKIDRNVPPNPPTKTEAEKYQKIVESHPIEVTAVTRREKRLEQLKQTEEKLKKQTLLARIVKMVKEW